MDNTSPRRPRFSGTGPTVFIVILGVLVLIALGFAAWGTLIYPATPTDTPMPIAGTLTAIAEAVGTLPATADTQQLPTTTQDSQAQPTFEPSP